MSTIIDLSKTIQYNSKEPRFMRIKIQHKSHRKGRRMIKSLLNLPRKLFPKHFIGWADDTIKHMGVHSATHLDAPYHYGPKSGGKKAKTIEQIPLEWCFGPGIVINMSHKKDFDPITIDDIKKDLLTSGAEIAPGTIVLIRTDRDKFQGSMDFFTKGTGMSAEATEWLIDQGIKVMGIDQWGWDLPLPFQVEVSKQSENREIFWAAHRVGIEKEYCHLEQMCNLAALPSFGFKVYVFPLKIKGASAGPVRAVAILD